MKMEIDLNTMAISMKMVNKLLELNDMQPQIYMQNSILINYMAVERWNLQVVTGIGGNGRMTRGKDMEHLIGLVEADTSGSTCRISDTGMEYTDGQMEKYIMDSGKRIRGMVTDIRGILREKNTMDHGRMAHDGEMQFKLRMGNNTHANLRKTNLSQKQK